MCFHINCWEFNLLLPLNSRTPLLHSNSWIMVVIFSRFFEFERSQMQWVDWMAIQNHCCDTLSSTHSWFFWHAKRFDILIHSRVLMLCSVCNVWLCVCVCVDVFLREREEIVVNRESYLETSHKTLFMWLQSKTCVILKSILKLLHSTLVPVFEC